MRTTLREVMAEAEKSKAARGSFSAASLEGAQAVIQAAEALGQPAILQYALIHEPVASLRVMGPILVRLAEEAAVPVCVHLDQADDLEKIGQALSMGFTSVTAGGGGPAGLQARLSHLEFTCRVRELADRYGASVEGELGGTVDSPDTDPEEAASFVRNSGVDVLAASIGTAHGKSACGVNLECLRQIRRETGLPVAIHGGSGLTAAQLRECIGLGVRKINFYTAGARAAAEYVRERLSQAAAQDAAKGADQGSGRPGYEQISLWGREAFLRTVTAAMEQFAMK